MKQPPEAPRLCDPDIYKNGKLVTIIAGGSVKIINFIVNEVAAETGEKIDWHYCAGRARILTTGNVEKVAKAFEEKKLVYWEG